MAAPGIDDIESGHGGCHKKNQRSIRNSTLSVGCGDRTGYLNAEASDRSLSYIDLRVGRKIVTEKSKVFESFRKFGRPRQQCSDYFGFMESAEKYMWEKDNNGYERRSNFGDFDSFNLDRTMNNIPSVAGRQSRRAYECSERGTRNLATDESNNFENRMYLWNENVQKNSLKESASKRTSSRSSFGEYAARTSKDTANPMHAEEDLEAQIQPRYQREIKRNHDNKSEDYYGITCESQYNADADRTRISEIRENWRLRILREDEERLRVDGTRHRVLQGRNAHLFVGEKELHRSKSTPDIIEGSGRHSDTVWPEEDNRKMNFSMMDVSARNWGVYNEQQEADSLNDPTSLNEPVSSPEPLGTRKLHKRFASGKHFFGHFLTSRGTTPTAEMLDYKEPFSQFWMVLSTLYGQALIILMLAFCLTEVMDNPVKMLTLQGVFLMYLYVGSIAVIICIYIWVLVDSCSSLNSSDTTGLVPPTITTSIVPDRERELRNMSVTKFGSLKKAHISRDRTSSTSFYLRVGAIAFGLGTLVFNGLEMAMHSMMEGSCLNDVVFVHPILHGLFTFLQMHFLFVNSQVLVERFGLAARFGFMHLAATNLALWIRLIIWESGNEWTYYVHLSQSKVGIHSSSEIPTPLQLRGFPKFVMRNERDIGFSSEVSSPVYRPISEDHIEQVVSLHHCLNTNSLGQLWTSSMPFLYPFIIQFSLIAAAVTFVMGQKVAKDRLFFQKQKKAGAVDKTASLPTMYDNISSWGVDCNRASKGLFLGLLCLVTGVVVIIIFLVVKEDEDFPTDTIFWLTNGTLLTILSITIFMSVIGLAQIRKLSVIGRKMTKLDGILSVISMLGVQLYGTFGILVGAAGLALDKSAPADSYFLTSNQKRHTMLLCLSVAQILQTTMQSSLISEGIRRTSLTRNQIMTKPARQVITFLLFSNAVLWAFDTFVVQSWTSQELQLRFFGVLVWGVISRIGLPLLVFFRFHSCVLLLEIWKRSYQSLHFDPGN